VIATPAPKHVMIVQRSVPVLIQFSTVTLISHLPLLLPASCFLLQAITRPAPSEYSLDEVTAVCRISCPQFNALDGYGTVQHNIRVLTAGFDRYHGDKLPETSIESSSFPSLPPRGKGKARQAHAFPLCLPHEQSFHLFHFIFIFPLH